MSHQGAVKAALQASDQMGLLFARMGTADHPRGVILSAYRSARYALSGNLGQPWLVEQVLAELTAKVEGAISVLLKDAQAAGEEQAEKTLKSYKLKVYSSYDPQVEAEVAAIRATLEAQKAAIRALVYSNAPSIETQILGDASRLGLLSPGPVTREGARWLATAVNTTFWGVVGSSLMNQGAQEEYKRQAIAAIDQVTTDCCLRVHGQVVGMNEDFHLTGTPRFADRLPNAPFHWNAIVAGEKCLTADGYKPIEDVVIGDLVFTHRGRFMPVTMALARKETGIALLINTDGGALRITREHPVLTSEGWKKAGLLRPGDIVLGCNKRDSSTSRRRNPMWFMPVRFDAHNGYPVGNDLNITKSVGILSRIMRTFINFEIKIQARKVKIKDKLHEWILKNKIDALNQSNGFGDVQEDTFADSGIGAVGLRARDSSFFRDASHMNRVFGFHSLGCNGIGSSNSGMNMAFPLTNIGSLDITPFNASFFQTALDHISGNAKLFGNLPFRDTGIVPINDALGINIHPDGHNNLPPIRQYNIKSIVTLELSESMVCDLSVAEDESYCINDHFVHNCRTSVALVYVGDVGDSLTEQMRQASGNELRAREKTGKRETIWPSHARSGRGG